MGIHTGDLPALCNDCGKGFRGKLSITKVNFVHTGERPFLCNECGKGLTKK